MFIAKQLYRKSILLCLLLVLSTLSPVYGEVAQQLPTKIIIGIASWPPHFSKNLKHNGVGCHIISEAYKTMGIEVEYIFLPSKRLMHSAADKTIDAIAVWGGWKDWIETHYGSDPIFAGRYVLWQRKSDKNFNWHDPKQLKGTRVGTIIGESLPYQFNSAVLNNDITVEEGSDLSSLFRMLLNDRIDLLPYNEGIALSVLNDHFTPQETAQFTQHPQILRTSLYRVLFNKENPNSIMLWQTLNVGLYHLHEEGKVKKMLKNSKKGLYKNK